MTLDELKAAAERVLADIKGHHVPARGDVVAAVEFVRDLLSRAPTGIVHVEPSVEGDGVEVGIGLWSTHPSNVPRIAADLLRAAESADGEVG